MKSNLSKTVIVSTFFLALLLGVGLAAAEDGNSITKMIADAKPGSTVHLPAGTFDIGEISVPPRVSIEGAGYDKTVLKVRGQAGLRLKGGVKNAISDLTVRDATNAGVVIEHSDRVVLSRVRVVRCLMGILATDSKSVWLENIVAGENRTGIVMNNCEDSVIVNCSLVANTAVGLSIGVNRQSAAFNNLIANSPTGVYVAPQNDSFTLDHNFYQTSAIGKSSDTAPPSVYVWRDQTGYDAHSVQIPVDFDHADEFSYRATNTLNWAPERAVTTGWGISKLSGFKAPEYDINGQERRLGWGVGAWEAGGNATRPADGSFKISENDGTKSAGIYAKDGRLMAWLFQNLPLQHGTYHFWLPSRDWQGQPIPSGDYELRVIEANLRFQPVGSGIAANTGWGRTREGLAQINNQQVLFDSQQRPVITLGWSEGGMNIRAFDAALGTERWFFPGTAVHAGAASDGHGNLYSLRQIAKQCVLVKLDEETGRTKEITPGAYNRFYTGQFSEKTCGMTVLKDVLYVADPEKNKLFTGAAADPAFTTGFDVASPSSPCADTKRGLIWLLSEKKRVLALDPSGAIKVQFDSPVPGPHSLAVNGDRMAILSYPTGKIHVFSLEDPAKPRPLFEISTSPGDVNDGALSRVSLNANGEVAEVEAAYGVRFFDAAGKLKKEFLGGWYNSFQISPPDKNGNVMTFDPSTGDRMCRLDSRHDTWRFSGVWQKQGSYSGMFEYQGKQYVLTQGYMDVTWDGHPTHRGYVCVGRLEDETVVPLVAISNFWLPANETVVRTDFSKPLNGPYVASDWRPLVSAAGKPVLITPGCILQCRPNGDLVVDCGASYVFFPLLGLDAHGVPLYDWDHVRHLECHATFTSPYDFKTKESADGHPPNRVMGFFSDGGCAQPISLKTGKMAALLGNWCGTDLAGFDGQGKLQWLQPLADIDGIHGGYIVDDFVFTVHVITSETEVFAKDGMFLGRLGQPKGLEWGGKWLDNALQFHPYRGAGGKYYMLYGDFNDCCAFWMSIEGLDKVKRHVQSVKIDAKQADALAALPLPLPPRQAAPPVTRIKITRLAGPMIIDGSMEKWRQAVPTPQVIVTPESGSAHIKGPADCSALIRFAHVGHDLYVQVIKFDDVVVMYQPLGKFYLQDGVEMSLNSYTSGFKFNVTRVNELGDIIMRDGFYNVPTKLLDPTKAPRKITVLDNARDVPERHLIENLYGIDLSQCKVIVTEFKVPLDTDTYEGKTDAVPDSASGKTVWIGVLVDDNDFPGGDVQEYETWPSTYSTFGSKESGALATFE